MPLCTCCSVTHLATAGSSDEEEAEAGTPAPGSWEAADKSGQVRTNTSAQAQLKAKKWFCTCIILLQAQLLVPFNGLLAQAAEHILLFPQQYSILAM